MAPSRKRQRFNTNDDDDESDDGPVRGPARGSKSQPQAYRRDCTRRQAACHHEDKDDEDGGEEEEEEEEGDGVDGEHTRQLGSLNISGSKHSGYEELIKKLVRLAFATEFRRVPLRRSEISAKVIEHSGIPFKHVFEGAQAVLGKTFGMRLMELPGKDKVTVAQRRQAQKAPTTSSSGVKSYLLVSILPRALQAHTAIMTPARIPTESEEAVYVGIHSTVVSIIALSGGSVSEQRLERYLKRLQIESKTPADRTERLMQRMCKDGYLIRHRDTSSGEEMVEYSIGARAKVEIGKAGVEGLVRTVYGEAATTELNNKLKRSLQLLGDLYPPPHEITPASNERCNRNADDMRDESD